MTPFEGFVGIYWRQDSSSLAGDSDADTARSPEKCLSGPTCESNVLNSFKIS